jgi:hypothetical protein
MSNDTPKVQGEGDYESARKYEDATKRFVDAGKVKPAAERARTDDPAELADLERAEQAGRARAKEEDPLLRPDAGGMGAAPGGSEGSGAPQGAGEARQRAAQAGRRGVDPDRQDALPGRDEDRPVG